MKDQAPTCLHLRCTFIKSSIIAVLRWKLCIQILLQLGTEICNLSTVQFFWLFCMFCLLHTRWSMCCVKRIKSQVRKLLTSNINKTPLWGVTDVCAGKWQGYCSYAYANHRAVITTRKGSPLQLEYMITGHQSLHSTVLLNSSEGHDHTCIHDTHTIHTIHLNKIKDEWYLTSLNGCIVQKAKPLRSVHHWEQFSTKSYTSRVCTLLGGVQYIYLYV